LFKRLFPELNFVKVFALKGKNPVIQYAAKYPKDKNKIFIVDLDLDDLKNEIVKQDNLFYLQMYCLENYLVEKSAIIELLIFGDPKKAREELLRSFDFQVHLNQTLNLLAKLAGYYIIEILWNLGLPQHGLNADRDIRFDTNPIEFQGTEIEKYFNDFKNIFAAKYPNESFDEVLKSVSDQYLADEGSQLLRIPGKDLLMVFHKKLKRNSLLPINLNLQQLSYQLAKDIPAEQFQDLKDKISSFLNR